MCSMHGLPTIGTIGFGWFEVSGRSRVPSPPAITTAFICATSRRTLTDVVRAAARTASADADPEEDERPVRARLGVDQDEADRRVEQPRRSLAEEADLERRTRAARRTGATDEHDVADEDDRERDPGEPVVDPEQDHAASIISRSASGSAIFPNVRLDVPASGEEPVDLVGDPRNAEHDRRRASCARRRSAATQHDEERDEREARDVSAFGSCASGGATEGVADDPRRQG